jgi:pimeloyl-ACP methyl ester carboxylesterase
MKITTLLLLALVLVPSVPANAGDSKWQFDGWQGPVLEVRMFVPEGATVTTPIVIVMHGWSREAQRYFDDWRALGAENDFIVVVPHFPVKDFPSSWNYNLGNVFDRQSRKPRPQSEWTFTAIESIFDAVVARVDGEQTEYTLFGHSAGSQFVHRFLYYMPDARVKRYLAANAGWYTLPDFDTEYPYGLGGAGISEEQLIAAFQKDMVLMLGREDLDQTDPDLRNTPEAKRQGKNRLARGLTMFDVAKANAEKLGVDLRWRLLLVDDAGHVNAQMASAAATLVE